MAQETHVLFGGKLPGRAALNRAMKELGFPLAISPGVTSLEGHSGYLPMKLRREETGAEFDLFEGRATVEELVGKDADPRFQRCGSFRWGGDENEMLAGLCAAAALAKLVDGVVLDEADNKLLAVDAAIDLAKTTLASVAPDARTDKLPGTRPADIRRYLKPLLQQRDDLVLVGRSLFIRPVRHLMRGAFFHRTSDKFEFAVFRMVKPLYQPSDSIDYDSGGVGGDWRVWQPHFQPLLMTMLAESAFARVGPITTFDDFAEHLSKIKNRPYIRARQLERITALQLAGKADRAAAYVEQLERDAEANGDRDHIRAHWKQVSNVSALCERLRAQEADTAKAMKLKHIWEPSPFPVELPTAERGRVAEPGFPTLPWVAGPSSPLLMMPPERPGEVRFAKRLAWHDDDPVLIAPLTVAEAEERHRGSETYLLAARLPDGFLMTIDRDTNWDRLKPGAVPYLRPSFHVHLFGFSQTITASPSSHGAGTGMLELWNIHVHDRASSALLWNASLILEHGTLGIWDYRSGDTFGAHTKSTISPALRDAAICQTPAFGEYTELAARLRSVLQLAGYGEIT
jgi:hypothetical protein